MSDAQILDIINSLYDVEERKKIRMQFEQDGYTQEVKDALMVALARQEAKKRREEAVMRPARWVARKTGRLVGRTMRKLEQEADKLEEAQ